MKAVGPRLSPRARAILGLVILIPVALLLWIVAYQLPLYQVVHVGGELELRRRHDDAPFLFGVNEHEPGERFDDPDNPAECERDPRPAGASCPRIWWWELLERTGEQPFRWTKAETTFLVPGAGPGRYSVDLRVAGGTRGATPTLWEAGPGLRYQLTIPPEARRFRLLASADAAGDLRLTMRTTPFAAPGDPRELGFVLYELRVAPAEAAPRAPAWPQLGWLALAIASVYVAAMAGGAGLWGASALSVGGALGAAYALAFHRPALTLFTPTLALLALLGAAASLGGLWASRRLGRRSELAAGLAPVAALAAVAFAVRAAGMLHPHALYSDSGLQANKLYELMLGRVFLTAGLPSDAGGGQAPYPPGPFIVLMPLALLFPAGHEARVLLMQTGTALLDSLTVAALWLILRRAGAGQRTALLGAACYLLPTAALESFSVGELANLGGQALALPFITLLAVGALSPGRKDQGPRTKAGQRPERLLLAPSSLLQPGRDLRQAVLAPAAAALCLGLLAHSGVTLSLGALVAAAWALAVAAGLQGRKGRPVDAARLTLVSAGGLGLAVLLFYSAPVYLEGALGQVGAGSNGGSSAWTILSETALGVLGLAPPGPRGLRIPTLLGVTALGGLALLWSARRGGRRAALRAALAAWWGGTLLTQGLLLVADQGVRWALFLYPGLCLSAGLLLAACWRRGPAGRTTATLILALILAYGLVAWIVQVRDYYHI